MGMDLAGRIKGVGGYFNVSYDRSEGLHQGVRDLIQLGTIELLGRIAKVPYEQCLKPESVSPGAVVAAETQFEGMSEEERVRFTQHRLQVLNDATSLRPAPYYGGAATGRMDAATRDAIARYRRQASLVGNAEIDLDLFRSLQNQAVTKVPSPPARIAADSRGVPALQFVTDQGQPLGDKVAYPVGSVLRFGIKVDRDAHVHCFLRNQENRVYRVFPTADQPNGQVAANCVTVVPAPEAVRQIHLDAPSIEEIGCIASARLMRAGLQLPLTTMGASQVPGASSLQEVLDRYQKESGGEPIGMSTFSFQAK